jgi:hypothetical protein
MTLACKKPSWYPNQTRSPPGLNRSRSLAWGEVAEEARLPEGHLSDDGRDDDRDSYGVGGGNGGDSAEQPH